MVSTYECNIQKSAYFAERLEYYRNIELHGGAVIKDGFYGGRTENFKFHHEASSNERIRYVDICSM